MSEKEKKSIIATTIVIIVVFIFIGCPIKMFFGISCPGCGLTRACMEACQLHFKEAFCYHPLYWLIVLILLYIGLRKKLKKRLKNFNMYEKLLITAVCFLYIGVYIFRILNHDPILEFNIEKSVLFKLVNIIGG